MDPLMDENFFIENPENLGNNFYNNNKDFEKTFKEKSGEIVEVMSKRARHKKKQEKSKMKKKQQPSKSR